MTTKEPRGESLLAARLARAYPSLSAYSAATLAEELCRIERAQRRHAERCCSGEDGGYVRHSLGDDGKPLYRCPIWCKGAVHGSYCVKARSHVTGSANAVVEHDPDAERKAGERIERRLKAWCERFAILRMTVRGAFGTATDAEFMRQAIELQHDPRGPVLLLRLLGDAEAVGV